MLIPKLPLDTSHLVRYDQKQGMFQIKNLDTGYIKVVNGLDIAPKIIGYLQYEPEEGPKVIPIELEPDRIALGTSTVEEDGSKLVMKSSTQQEARRMAQSEDPGALSFIPDEKEDKENKEEALEDNHSKRRKRHEKESTKAD